MSSASNTFEKNASWLGILPESMSTAKWIIAASLALALLGVGVYRNWFGGSGSNTGSLLTYRVEARDLPITIIERGNLESQKNVKVLCEVDDYRSDGISGTPIVWVIPNGTSVKKGDLICEIDSTAIQSELDDQTLDTEEAKSAFAQAEANLQNQKIQNDTDLDKATLDVELAKLELEMFNDKDMGSHILAVEEIERQIDDVNNEILTAEMNLDLKRNEKVGMESLFKLGFAGKSELDRAVLGYLQAEGDYAAKLNKLKTQLASRDKMDHFDRKMQKLQLEGNVKTAEQNLKQVRVTNNYKLSQMEEVLASRQEQLRKEKERLARYQRQLDKCKIIAPQDGMVAYATPYSSRDAEIAEGVPVRQRQHILSIPNMRHMQVETSVHESVLDRVQKGLNVTVTVDAFQERKYKGTIKSVAVLPERNYYSETKTYKTIITIDEDVYQLKPGMTAVCEVDVANIADVNVVPIQAVVQRSGSNWVYVKTPTSVERRDVAVGANNDQYVVIEEGVDVGDLVVLNPASVHNENSNSEDLHATPIEEGESESLVAKTQQSRSIN